MEMSIGDQRTEPPRRSDTFRPMSDDNSVRGSERFEHITITEYNDAAADYGRTPGEQIIRSGIQRNTHVRDEEIKEFVKIGEAVAIIELPSPLTNEEVTDWCNSEAGKLALAHWFDHVDPLEVGSP